MYLKLVVRSLWRHQKRGRKLFVLLALCSAALIGLITFQADFDRQYTQLFIGTKTGHLQVLPSASPVFETTFGAQNQDLALFATDELDRWVSAQPEVEAAAPFIEREGLAYNLDSEMESWFHLVAVPADRRDRLFPLARVQDGDSTLAWSSGEVPMLRARLVAEFGQKNPDHSRFDPEEVKPKKLETLKEKLTGEFPGLFDGRRFAGADNDKAFFDAWAKALPRTDLPSLLPPARVDEYDYRVDDALVALKENSDASRLPFLNKKLFQALYHDELWNVREAIVPGKSVTLQIPGLRNEGALALPKIIPARYVGMVDIMPLYTPDSFMDLEAFRHYMGAEQGLAAGYVIRLKETSATDAFAAKLGQWLKERGLSDLRVADYRFLGKLYLTTSMTFVVIIDILIGVFVLIVGLFIVNLVLLTLVQRRAEIGTGIALGLSTGQTVAVLLGEIAALVTVSWLGGAVLGAGLVALGHFGGIPGMIFFPGQKLYQTFQAEPFLVSYLLMLPSALLAAVFPLSGLRKRLPVDFFREAR